MCLSQSQRDHDPRCPKCGSGLVHFHSSGVVTSRSVNASGVVATQVVARDARECADCEHTFVTAKEGPQYDMRPAGAPLAMAG